MAIESRHASYGAAVSKWQRCRDAVAGQDAVQAAGTLYLPKLKDQKDDDYNAYKLRAGFYNATGRTLEGLVGLVFRKPPMVTNPAAMDAIIDDIDLQGTSLSSLAQHVLNEVLEVGRIGILIEHPTVEQMPANMAQAAAMNLRPYAAVYQTESILDWKLKRVNNVMQPVMVKLSEMVDEAVDEFTSDTFEQLRALLLIDGIYLQRLYRKNDKGVWIQHGGDIIPLMNGKPLDFIPFYAFGPKANELQIQESPILDLVDLNLAHYRVTADYEHGCHFTGLPMLFLAGVELMENEKVYLGSQTAVTTTRSAQEADGKFIEFTGQGLGALEKNLDRKEKQMAAIGARMLEQQKAGVESEGAMEMRANGENSVLASIANLVSRGMTQMLAFMQKWANGGTAEISIQLSTDFMPVGMQPQMLDALTKALQSGSITQETYFYNLERGEMIKPGTTFDDFKEQLTDVEPSLTE